MVKDSDFIHAGNILSTLCMAFFQSVSKPKIICDLRGDLISEAKLKLNFNISITNIFNYFQAEIADRFALNRSDFFLAICQPLKEIYIQKGIPEDRIWLIRNGVDTTLFDFQEVKKHDECIITYAGGFQVWQGIDNLLRAIERSKKLKKIKFKLIGFDNTNTELKKMLKKKFRNKVILVDRVPQQEMIAHLKSSSFFILTRDKHPVVYHSFPSKFAEYLAIGRPIIVTDVDETASFVRRYKCGVVSKSGPESLARAIEQACELSLDEIRAMGQNARDLAVQQFDWKIISEQYFNHLKQLN
jgi:glycosyltransferase involved in cell wall biosynthesis